MTFPCVKEICIGPLTRNRPTNYKTSLNSHGATITITQGIRGTSQGCYTVQKTSGKACLPNSLKARNIICGWKIKPILDKLTDTSDLMLQCH